MLYYCNECKRIFSSPETCSFCNSSNVLELKKDAPINIIGTKLKARVQKIQDGKVVAIVVDEHKNKTIKEFEASKIRKIV